VDSCKDKLLNLCSIQFHIQFIYFLNYIYILFILSLYYEIIIKDKINKFNGDIDL